MSWTRSAGHSPDTGYVCQVLLHACWQHARQRGIWRRPQGVPSLPRSVAHPPSRRCPVPPCPHAFPAICTINYSRPGVAMPKGHSSLQQFVCYYKTYPAAHLWPLLAATAPCADKASLNSTNAVPLPRPVVRSITSLRACPPAGEPQTRDILLKAALSPPSNQHQRTAAAVRVGDKHQTFLCP